MESDSSGRGETWRLSYPRYQWNDVWARYDPTKLELYQTWTNEMLRHTELPPKYREYIIVAIDAIVAWPAPYIDGHIHEAFNQGATARELAEVIEVAGYIMGVHALNHGLTALQRVVDERRASNRPTPLDQADAQHTSQADSDQ